MPSLNEIVRSTIRQPKEVFVESLRNTISDIFDTKMNEKYNEFKSNLFDRFNTIVEEQTPEKSNKIINESLNSFITSLKESYFSEKTIIHKFRDGNTVAISPEDSHSLVQMHDSLNIINQEKMRNLMSESFSEYNKILKFSKKHRKD
jgi:hypothetical protein